MAGKDRKKQLARQRYERQQERRVQRQAKSRRVKMVITGSIVALIAGGSGAFAFEMQGGGGEKISATPVGASAAPARTPGSPRPTAHPAQDLCGYLPLSGASAQNADRVGRPPATAAKGTYAMTIDTSLGKIGVRLDSKKSPCTVNSFAYLAAQKFFDNTVCHRLVTQGIKVLQCGDPTGAGTGGPSYGFGNEYVPKGDAQGHFTYRRGMVAMAHSSLPNSNGSQFFIVYGDSPLPADYTIFGEVTEGLGVVDTVAAAGATAPDANGNTAPNKKIQIKHLTVAKM